MLDINLFRVDKGGNLELLRQSQRARGHPVEWVDEVVELDEAWRKADFQVNAANKAINAINKDIGLLMKAKKRDEAAPLLEQKKELEENKKAQEALCVETEKQLQAKLNRIGNLVHPSVPISMDEKDNEIVRMWWPEGRNEDAERKRRVEVVGSDSVKDHPRGVPGLYSHHEVLERLDGYDPVRGANVAGHRGYFLTGPGVDLNLALIQYGLSFLGRRGYKKLWTPFFMKRDVMARTAQLEQFDEELYKVVANSNPEDENPDNIKYLIATSEQPISAFHQNEWFSEPEKDLPKKYAGISTCFRKEAGSHGKDTWGIFRIHQFEKVEQFVLTAPDASWDMFEEMFKASEEFYQSLGIPYRAVAICSGALNNAAAKKLDLEAWFPFQCEYKELVSCSNCLDYQSRNLDIRCGAKSADRHAPKQYVHCLNSTLTATERALCCILENYQTPEGVVVPEVLRPYVGADFLPFVKELAPTKVEKLTNGVKKVKV